MISTTKRYVREKWSLNRFCWDLRDLFLEWNPVMHQPPKTRKKSDEDFSPFQLGGKYWWKKSTTKIHHQDFQQSKGPQQFVWKKDALSLSWGISGVPSWDVKMVAIFVDATKISQPAFLKNGYECQSVMQSWVETTRITKNSAQENISLTALVFSADLHMWNTISADILKSPAISTTWASRLVQKSSISYQVSASWNLH